MFKFNPGNVQIRFLPGQMDEVDNFVSFHFIKSYPSLTVCRVRPILMNVPFLNLFDQILFSSIQIRITVFNLNLGNKKKLTHSGTDEVSISAFD